MPTYLYRASKPAAGCKRCRNGFEAAQHIVDAPLARCPECGKPVERQITAPYVNTKPTARSLMNDKALKRKGFTKLINEGGGKFRKI